jgi:hypothetical protein
MMTGRELIIYILSNNLEDQPVCENGRLLGFMTVEEAAAKFEVGMFTVETLVNLEMLGAVRIGDTIYIPYNSEYPVKKEY